MRSASKKTSLEKGNPSPDNERREEAYANAGEIYETAGLWQSILDALDDGISAHSADGKIIYANSRMLEILGKVEPDIIGNNCQQVFQHPPCPHEQVMASGSAIKMEGGFQDGQSVFSLTVSPLKDNQGDIIGFIRVVRDISETERAQQELLKAEHFATLGQMVSGIAHDVGTPLNIISGYSEYLLMRAGPEGTGQKELSTIIQQTRRIADFIKQLLDLARPAQGRRDAIELKGFLADSLEFMGSHLRKANVKASLLCNTASSVIYGDGPRLRQAMFNLIMKAAKNLGPGSEIQIVIEEASEHPDSVPLLILGTEPGGQPHDFSKSLSGFLSSSQERGVSGMGLSLTKEILNEFGAGVELIVMAGGGVGLVIYLPKGSGDRPLSH
jgi:PAS domain S-box-containing protein